MDSQFSSLDDEALEEIFYQEKKINETLLRERASLLRELQELEREQELHEEFRANSSTTRLRQLQQKNGYLESVNRYERSFIRTCLAQRLDHIRKEYSLIQKRIEFSRRRVQEDVEAPLARLRSGERSPAYVRDVLRRLKRELECELRLELKRHCASVERQSSLNARISRASLQCAQASQVDSDARAAAELEQQFSIRLSRHRRHSDFVSLN